MMMNMMMRVDCGHCGYQWEPRVSIPKSCPFCKQYLKEDRNDTPLAKRNSFYKSIDMISDKELVEISSDYNLPLTFIKNTHDSLTNYCLSTGKKYKNYYATLRNWVKRDAMRVIDKTRNTKHSVQKV